MAGVLLLLVMLTVAVPVHAACPPDCVPGGGPASTDCLVVWGGVADAVSTCVDGDVCDLDGTADGVCSLGLVGCINYSGMPECAEAGITVAPRVRPRKSPLAAPLEAALDALDPFAEGCTPPNLTLPLNVSLKGIRAAKSKLRVTAKGTRKDKDKLVVACAPSPTPPSLTIDVQPILSAKCATSGCHAGPAPAAGQSLEAGATWAANVGIPSTGSRQLPRIEPGSLKRSFMARKLLGGRAIPKFGGVLMPEGCPDAPPEGGCLTDAEKFTILSWIANGAPNN